MDRSCRILSLQFTCIEFKHESETPEECRVYYFRDRRGHNLLIMDNKRYVSLGGKKNGNGLYNTCIRIWTCIWFVF